jgi:hypothetical protein
MKDTLTPSAPVIEPYDLNIVFETGDGPLHALNAAKLSAEGGKCHAGYPSGATRRARYRAIRGGFRC